MVGVSPRHGVDCAATPVVAAMMARRLDRAAVAWRRCVEALGARLAELDATDHLVDRRHAPHVALGEVGLAKRMPQRDDLRRRAFGGLDTAAGNLDRADRSQRRSEEHTSELQSLMRTSYAVFCLKKKNTNDHSKY